MSNQIHIDIYSLVLLIGAFQGFFFAVLLMFTNPQRRAMNLHLAFILIAFGLQLFHQFLVETGYIYLVKSLVGFNLPLDIVVGISLYWYIRNITHPELDNSFKSVTRHYLILLPGILLAIPYWMLDFEPKLALIKGGNSSEFWPPEIFYYLLALFSLTGVVFSLYFFQSIKLFIHHKRRIKNIFSYREKVTLSWMTNFLWFFGAGSVLAMAYVVVLDDVSQSVKLFQYISVYSTVFVIYIGIMGLKQPRIYRSSKTYFVKDELQAGSTMVNEISTIHMSDIDSKDNEKYKYKNSALTSEMSDRILIRLREVMDVDKPYLENNLTLPQLSSLVSTAPNYLSQVINEQLKMNFFDFVNSYRIETAKQLMINPLPHTSTILDVAMESAFNSKSAFYSAFKKQMGVTPSQYKKSLSL